MCSQQNLVVLILYGITVLQLDVISSTSEWKYLHPAIDNDLSDLHDDQTVRISLLPDTGGQQNLEPATRYRRAAAEPDVQAGSPRGYKGQSIQSENDLLGKVDINEDNFKRGYQHENFTMKNETLKYYDPKFLNDGTKIFFDLDKANVTAEHKGRVMEHSMLSQSYRRAATVTLNFRFPFYGHEVENITIATGGFLYTGDYVHSWLAATQYIAPLMANFDTSNNHEAKIRYLDTNETFIVEWNNVYLQEGVAKGPFTFQVHLRKNGDIYFAYERIPLKIETIKDEEHPVKVGLSDAYIIDRTIFFVKRKTIYEYNRINMKNRNIRDNTAIVFTALFTCNQQTNCSSCLLDSSEESEEHHRLDCGWCPALNRCSDGMDRKRQDWLNKNCDKNQITVAAKCEAGDMTESDVTTDYANQQEARSAHPHSSSKRSALSAGSISAIVFFILLIMLAFGWTGYAYFFPHSASGQFLIRNRPGAWRWRMGGTRYTAASSIHM